MGRLKSIGLLTAGGIAAAMLAGAPARAATESVVYSFKGGSDGAYPAAPLTLVGSTLYGTTTSGGGLSDGGTVFSIAPDGTETVLHAFQGTPGGEVPSTGLLDDGSTLLGTTFSGGGLTGRFGTVFSMTPAGATQTLFHFTVPLGVKPAGPLVRVGRQAFGLSSDGHFPPGVLYRVTPTGKPRIVHVFAGLGDGTEPLGALTETGGVLYGTTLRGGLHNAGTVFAVTPDGTETILHKFSFAEASEPRDGVTAIRGTLYGTTARGGPDDCGAVFKVAPDGTETVMHFLLSDADGCKPLAGLTRVGNMLYGTALFGGSGGAGTVFSITLAGRFTVIHDFLGPDGEYPEARLLNVGGTLYGTTRLGGTSNSGTVFKLVP